MFDLLRNHKMKMAFFDENGKINQVMNINLNKHEFTTIDLPE